MDTYFDSEVPAGLSIVDIFFFIPRPFINYLLNIISTLIFFSPITVLLERIQVF